MALTDEQHVELEQYLRREFEFADGIRKTGGAGTIYAGLGEFYEGMAMGFASAVHKLKELT